eukprot:scaffold34722_cov21-Tisochrysis_lutea.AAC.2
MRSKACCREEQHCQGIKPSDLSPKSFPGGLPQGSQAAEPTALWGAAGSGGDALEGGESTNLVGGAGAGNPNLPPLHSPSSSAPHASIMTGGSAHVHVCMQAALARLTAGMKTVMYLAAELWKWSQGKQK